MYHQLQPQDIKAFALGGNALITLESADTGVRYTYKLHKPEGKPVTFVSLLTGADNVEDYQYIGYFREDLIVRTSCKSKLPISSKPCMAISYFLKDLSRDYVHPKLRVYHSCKCGRCGRALTTPESIQRGLGPECFARLGA